MLCKTELTCGHLVVQPKNPSKKLKLVNKAMYSHWENAEKKRWINVYFLLQKKTGVSPLLSLTHHKYLDLTLTMGQYLIKVNAYSCVHK